MAVEKLLTLLQSATGQYVIWDDTIQLRPTLMEVRDSTVLLITAYSGWNFRIRAFSFFIVSRIKLCGIRRYESGLFSLEICKERATHRLILGTHGSLRRRVFSPFSVTRLFQDHSLHPETLRGPLTVPRYSSVAAEWVAWRALLCKSWERVVLRAALHATWLKFCRGWLKNI